MPSTEQGPLPTIFLYTEEQRGKQLVESPVVGMISDIAGMEKLIVVKDVHNHLDFVYKIVHDSANLDALAIVCYDHTGYDGRTRINVHGITYRLGKPEDAIRLLRGKTRWIQDKGSVLAVLLDGASSKQVSFASRRMARTRLQNIPDDAQVVALEAPPQA